jgi:hypothetical protein
MLQHRAQTVLEGDGFGARTCGITKRQPRQPPGHQIFLMEVQQLLGTKRVNVATLLIKT